MHWGLVLEIDEVTDVGAWIIEHIHTPACILILCLCLSLTHSHTHTQVLKTADGHKRYVEYRNKRAQ